MKGLQIALVPGDYAIEVEAWVEAWVDEGVIRVVTCKPIRWLCYVTELVQALRYVLIKYYMAYLYLLSHTNCIDVDLIVIPTFWIGYTVTMGKSHQPRWVMPIRG